MRIEKLNENTKKNLLDDLLKRSPNNYGKFEASVQEILNAVKETRLYLNIQRNLMESDWMQSIFL